MKPYDYDAHVSDAKKPLTVKEFKELGGRPVDMDKCIFAGEELTFNGRDVAEVLNDAVITEFTWRPLNTLPDNPKFKCDVDIASHSWRPLLDQSESNKYEFNFDFANHVSDMMNQGCGFTQEKNYADNADKPVFTQEMYDAGKLPPVGSKCIAVWQIGGDKCESEVIIAHINGNQVACVDSDSNYLIQYISDGEYFKPIDTRTQKQKAVDDMLELDLWATDREFCENLYDAGYRKTDKED